MTDTVRIALIPGDGIGPEVVGSASRVLKTLLGDRLKTCRLDAGLQTFLDTGSALPEAVLEELSSCDGALFGAVSSPSHALDGYRSPIVALRRRLDLFANLRPLVSAPIDGVRPGIDILLVRENTEGLYAGLERLEDDGRTAVAERRITRHGSERITEVACRAALSRLAKGGRGRLTIAHKANVLKQTDGLFRSTAFRVAESYPELDVEEQLIDSLVYRLIREPERYDVIVAPNLYGDILADAGAALVGGLGLVPSANTGYREGRPWMVAEPVHGSAPDIAGQDRANPCATWSAAALLLESLGLTHEASRLQLAIDHLLRTGPKTRDLGGVAGTNEMTDAVVEVLSELPCYDDGI